MFIAKLRTVLLALALAQGATAFTVANVTAQEVVLPATAAEHEALAKKYRDEAAGHRKSAADHKKMADAYAKSHYAPKTGDNPWTVKMQKHCAALVQDYEKLATDAEKMADFHSARAKEVAGK
jgi:hypothetical protein